MEKGNIIELTISDMTDDGKGIGHVDGMAIFVDRTIPGDRVSAKISRMKKRYAIASLVEILEPSADREEAVCPYFEKCGGCSLQSMKYEAQVQMKLQHVRDKLTRLGGLKDPVIRDIIVNPQGPDIQYRNKAVFAVFESKDGPLVGFRRRGSSQVVDIDDCMLQKEPVLAVARAVRRLIASRLITVNDERRRNPPKDGKARLREFSVRVCEGTGEMMVVLTLTSKKLANSDQIILALDDAVNEASDEYSLESVVYEIKRGDIHDPANDYIVAAGARTIRDQVEIAGRNMNFEISAPAFYQVNTRQMVRLYEKVRDYAALTGEEVLFDLYCGIGTIGLSMADQAAMVVGIEEVPGAILDANRNAVINGIVNARYYLGKAEEMLPCILDPSDKNYADYLFKEDLSDRTKVVVLDPPRGGCDEKLLDTVAAAGADRVVYVSCDAGTLARDVRHLQELGYEFVEATPVEMFAWTMHVETVALMSRIKG